jgi:hypothetical protein
LLAKRNIAKYVLKQVSSGSVTKYSVLNQADDLNVPAIEELNVKWNYKQTMIKFIWLVG